MIHAENKLTDGDSPSDHTYVSVGVKAGWALRLLYAPLNGQPALGIRNRACLAAGLILATDNLQRRCGITPPFEFVENDGFVGIEHMNAIIEMLSTDGLIRYIPDSSGSDGITLTYQGIIHAAELYTELSDEAQYVLSWVRSEYMSQDMDYLYIVSQQEYVKGESEFIE